MTDLEMQLSEIDRRRALLEMMIHNLPPIRQQCCDYGRAQLEDELAALWAVRNDITRQLK